MADFKPKVFYVVYTFSKLTMYKKTTHVGLNGVPGPRNMYDLAFARMVMHFPNLSYCSRI